MCSYGQALLCRAGRTLQLLTGTQTRPCSPKSQTCPPTLAGMPGPSVVGRRPADILSPTTSREVRGWQLQARDACWTAAACVLPADKGVHACHMINHALNVPCCKNADPCPAQGKTVTLIYTCSPAPPPKPPAPPAPPPAPPSPRTPTVSAAAAVASSCSLCLEHLCKAAINN